LGGLADGDRHGEREEEGALVERSQDRRVEQSRAGRGGPGAALPAPTLGLLVGGQHGAVRGAFGGELAGARVRRVDPPVVPVRPSEPPLRPPRPMSQFASHSEKNYDIGGWVAASDRRAARRPSTSWRSASTATSRPASRAASLVIGPIETMRA